ncbi:MAG TPA: tetratricopeptide repeat protein [Verrucomicrobiae bacterium]|jgi:tetratricopeptide (TPR) repeat protein|nr:tetratricopeptide repeat protein [Verrucomicrobiae bacterium]
MHTPQLTPDFLVEHRLQGYERVIPMKLEPPDTHHVNAAQGWLGLGNANEANAELDKIPDALQSHPDVLELRWQVYANARKWQQCVEVGARLVELAPRKPQGWIHRSYALHELKQTRDALEALLPAVTLFPKEWLIQYNLACYCCRLDEPERALQFLRQAFKLGDAKEVKPMALTDPDLREVWKKIETM